MSGVKTGETDSATLSRFAFGNAFSELLGISNFGGSTQMVIRRCGA